MPKASIIIPTYNAEKYIAETIRSVLAQTCQDFEILIIDDASPDSSVEVCQQFTDSRIKIIHQLNRGLPGARNTGIRHAQGNYISFLDADDLWDSRKLEKHIEHLKRSPEVGISFSYSRFIDEAGNQTGLCQAPKKLKGITLDYILCRNPIGNGSAAVIRRQVFESIEYEDNLHGFPEAFYFDERLRHQNADATDVECWLRIAATTKWKLEGIPEFLTLYRVNSGGLSANSTKQLEALEKVIEKARSYAGDSIARSEHTARAYHLRYTARRAVTLRDGLMSVTMIHRALASDWSILIKEPIRTLTTIGAAYLLLLLPKAAYTSVEKTALKIIRLQKKTVKVETQTS
jgi:glycosyltransferase involved in cell wall biosynthesis